MEKNYTIGKLTQGLNYKKREREKNWGQRKHRPQEDDSYCTVTRLRHEANEIQKKNG